MMDTSKVNLKEEAIEWIHSLKTLGIKPGLARMEWMMEKLNHPERNIKFLHVAGTNGKGSTVSFISQVLKKSGYRVGTFTSPYIIDFTNRIQINGEDISGEDLVSLVNKIIPLAKELEESEWGAPTEFEVVTAIAILYFGAVAYPDIVIWETGLGGRLDSTNIVYPILTVITNIGYDHMDLLGYDIRKIASEKAGIIKSGVSLISGVENEEALEVIKSTAEEKKATVYQLNEQFSYNAHRINHDGSLFDFKDPYLTMPDIKIKMIGPHQVKNAAVSLMALEVLRQFYAFIIDEDAVYSGMKSTFWAGRFELISEKPRVILDGAHNPQGAESLRETISLFDYKRAILVTGILKDKAIKDFYEEILPIADELIITQPNYGRAAEVDVVEKIIHEIDQEKKVRVYKDYKDAINEALAIATPDDLVLFTGSLYLIADIRRYLMENKD